MSVTGFNLRSFPVSRPGLFMPSLQNPVTVFNQASGAGMCIPGDALPPGAARRRRRAGGRPGLFPREAKLDPSQLLAQQISPRTELPESRGLRYAGWTFPEAVPGLAAIPGGCTALLALLILPRSSGHSIHGRPCRCGKAFLSRSRRHIPSLTAPYSRESQDAAVFLLVLDEEQTLQQPKGFIPRFWAPEPSPGCRIHRG